MNVFVQNVSVVPGFINALLALCANQKQFAIKRDAANEKLKSKIS
jgi:hypothetical protein